jgi:hypothetical protein
MAGRKRGGKKSEARSSKLEAADGVGFQGHEAAFNV